MPRRLKPKIDNESIETFIKTTGASAKVAEFYLKQYPDISDAINAFFDSPIDLTNTKPSKKKTQQKRNTQSAQIIKDTFNKYQVNGVLRDDGLSSFLKELGMSEDGYINYVLSYAGNTKSFAIFKEDNIEAIIKKIPFTGKYSEDVKEFYEETIPKEYHRFLMFVHSQLKAMIYELNKENNCLEKITEKELNKSFCTSQEGRVELIDMVNDVLNDILPDSMSNSPVNKLFWDFVKTVKKRLSVTKDEFSFIVDFLKEFPTVSSMKLSQEQIDEKLYLPQLYQDFLEYINKPQDKENH
ncbi:hypothetical protein EHI8A_126400 [Entamoeba histolytica HM-1:IMSS-B]|uniref:Uncharacterized protein n=5 Tax=Entamoeba histolytica TaxID=5759 RepID=C4MAN0_ENTH1|nr:hypothetical protein EHI_020070 [Entamoeba histolytica HM-1:IMSS]EMD46475.1 Hypothetical protein EHI5A_145550 [Entamoeba histolytica KU27]EMH77054.1 hypothetical protein EHI8A_126400 [Entamoeba histolytica HM-1:IMSS-B]ENY62024.1 hypothetical protein EHI7A_118630 [Entamoeba histolytica HM-1:IMSS-A]GAT98882.1 hypothetical protein CL6EHI_020070 [Entamoeba histolytica]EAL44824.2 hypothetical protein EHI_020070 [Entamoeba histolytica HM-1:IMSS]|eukprot:XP_650206.2 hypothetical protein EHI_020070 [Entamoeba histolytica HM-1:IMSS]